MGRRIKRKTFKSCIIGTSILFLIYTSSPVKNVNGKYESFYEKNYEVSLADIKDLDEDIHSNENDDIIETVLVGIDPSSYSLETLKQVKNQIKENNEVEDNEEKILVEKINAKDITEVVEKEKRTKLVNYYSNVYNLDEEKVLKIIKKETNLFKNKSLKKKSNKKLELEILKKVKSLTGRVKKEYDYEKTKTYREMVYHYAELYGIDKEKALAIELHETAKYTSPLFLNQNNPGGMKNINGDYYSFENKEQGIITHVEKLLKNYNGQSLDEMAKRYAEGSKTWAGKVRYFLNTLEQNPKAFTLRDEKKK